MAPIAHVHEQLETAMSFQQQQQQQWQFRQPSAVTCTALPSECTWPSGFFCRWPEGLECTPRRSPGSYAQQWQFPLDTQDIPIRWTLTASSALEADAAMRYRNLRLTLTLTAGSRLPTSSHSDHYIILDTQQQQLVLNYRRHDTMITTLS